MAATSRGRTSYGRSSATETSASITPTGTLASPGLGGDGGEREEDDGRRRAARNGHGCAATERRSVAGKTGTATNPIGAAHSWFVCFAPADNPRVAVAVIVENGGYGADVAAPIARDVLRVALGNVEVIDEQTFNNRYRLDRKLGEGGMATVYCGTDTVLASARRNQSPSPAICGRRRVRSALLSRGGVGSASLASEHRQHVRRRPRRRHLLHRDGIGRRPVAGRDHQLPTANFPSRSRSTTQRRFAAVLRTRTAPACCTATSNRRTFSSPKTTS